VSNGLFQRESRIAQASPSNKRHSPQSSTYILSACGNLCWSFFHSSAAHLQSLRFADAIAAN